MGIYDRGETLQAGTVPFSERYISTAMKGQKADKDVIRRQALKEIAQGYASRGISGSGIAQLSDAQARQNFADEDARFRQNLGLQAANLGEENRRRLEKRNWQTADRELKWKRDMELLNRKNQRADENSGANLWGNVIGTAGSIVGSIYGGPVGGAIGGAAGKGIGGIISGKGKKKAPVFGANMTGIGNKWTGVENPDMTGSGWGG